MKLLCWLEKQNKDKVYELLQVIKESAIQFSSIDEVNSEELFYWLLENKDGMGTLVITDASHEIEEWELLVNSIKSGFIIHVSTDIYKANLTKECMIKRAADINRAIHYYQSSVNSPNSQMRKYISLESEPERVQSTVNPANPIAEKEETLDLPFKQEDITAFPSETTKAEDIQEIYYPEHGDIQETFPDYSEDVVETEYATNTNNQSNEQITIEEEHTTVEVPQTKKRYVVPIKNKIQDESTNTNPLLGDVQGFASEQGEKIIPEESIKPIEALEKEEVLVADIVKQVDVGDKVESDFKSRSRNIQRQLFSKQKWFDNQTIAIWSPIHKMGVTTFAMNFALFLAENRIYTALLEGLSEQPIMKDWLMRYSDIPLHWKSYAATIQNNDEDPLSAEWNYRNVMFLPLNSNDGQFSWNEVSLESFMTTTNIVDITLVDLPTGKMAKHTEALLKYVDQLWIIVDDTFQEVVAWKKYIHQLKKDNDVQIHLIFNKEYEFSQSKRLEKELGIKLMAKLPSMHELVMRNYYETEPLYINEEANPLLQEGFEKIAQHLFNNKFELRNDSDKLQKSENWLGKLLKPLKRNHMFGKLNG